MRDSQEVVARHLVIEDRAVIHVVLEHSESLDLLRVNLPQQWSSLLLLFEDLGSVRAHVHEVVGSDLSLLGEG